jgi:hypothetical protein
MDRAQREAYIEWCISGLHRRGLRVIGLEHGGSQLTPVSLGSGKREIHIDVASGLQNVASGLQGYGQHGPDWANAVAGSRRPAPRMGPGPGRMAG